MPKIRTGTVFASCCLVGIWSCANQTPQAALLEQPSPAATQVLAKAASELLAGRSVSLAADAFTRRPELSFEPTIRSTPQGRLATGRTRALPPELRLVRVAGHCELEEIATGRRRALPGLHCRAISELDD